MNCTSGNLKSFFAGKNTECHKTAKLSKQACYYFCGGYNIINQNFDLLVLQGIST